MLEKLLVTCFALLVGACAGKDDNGKPCVGDCASANNGSNNVANNDTPDMSAPSDIGMPNSVTPDLGVPGDLGGLDLGGPDAADVGSDTDGDSGTDMPPACTAQELLCNGACAACPADVNVFEYACVADACVISTCDVGYEVCPMGCCPPPGPAMTGPVSTQSFTALDTSIALDPNGYPRIGYRNFFNTNLEVTAWDGRQWVMEVVDNVGSPEQTSLAVDTMGITHVAWIDSAAYDLKYARRAAAGWQVATVDSAGDVGVYPSLALDAMGRPHIAYKDMTNGELKYARWTGSAWMTTTVDPGTGSAGWFASLELDSMGRPVIAHVDFSLYAVRVARFNGTAWVTTTAETRGSIPQYVSLALDSTDRPHIMYLDNPAQDLRYLRFDGANWIGELADTTANYGYSSTLVLDANDQPHVLYHDGTTDDARYAVFDGASWQVTELSATETIGPYSSLALDAAGVAHLSLSIKGPTPVELRYVRLP